jgi:hypothetical protein
MTVRVDWRRQEEERFLSARADAFAGANAEEKSAHSVRSRKAIRDAKCANDRGATLGLFCGGLGEALGFEPVVEFVEPVNQTRIEFTIPDKGRKGEEERFHRSKNMSDGAEVSLRRPTHSSRKSVWDAPKKQIPHCVRDDKRG